MTYQTDIEGPTPALLRQWDELATATSAPPFLYPGWTQAWWRAFGRGRLEVATVRRGRALVCALPVRRRPRLLQSPTNAHTPLFGPVSAEPAALRALGSRIQSGAWCVDLGYLDDDAQLAADLRGSGRQGWHIVDHCQLRSPYVDTTGSWERYWAGRKRRQEISRSRRRLAEQGDLAARASDGTVNLDALLDDGFTIEASGWKGAEGSAINSRDDTRRFYRDVARWAAERGWLRLAYMTLDGAMIAFAFRLRCHGVDYLIKAGYDETYRRYSPGVLNLMDQMQDAFAAGCSSYEMLGDATEHKMRWADGVRDRSRVIAFPPTVGGRGARSLAAATSNVHASMMAYGRNHMSAGLAMQVRRVARQLRLL